MLRVMSYNIRFDNPEDGPHAWAHRRDLVGRRIQDQEADVVGLQEALVHQLRDLEARLPGYARVGHGREGGEHGEFCAILVRSARFRVLETGTFWLSETPDEPGSLAWGATIPRIATWAHLDDPVAGFDFFAFNTHLDHRSERARTQASRLLVNEVGARTGSTPAIVMGDFNADPDSAAYAILSAAWEDAHATARDGHHGPEATFHGFDGPSTAGATGRIDYVFLKGIRARHHAILEERPEGRYASDHLPVFCVVESPTAPRAGSDGTEPSAPAGPVAGG